MDIGKTLNSTGNIRQYQALLKILMNRTDGWIDSLIDCVTCELESKLNGSSLKKDIKKSQKYIEKPGSFENLDTKKAALSYCLWGIIHTKRKGT